MNLGFRLRAFADTHIGLRDHNEDAVLVRNELRLFAVADGAGGENAGNIASAMAMTAMAHFFERTEQESRALPDFDTLGLAHAAKRLSQSIHHANREILALAEETPRYHGMGTTIVAAHMLPNRRVLHLAHVGDSRCYRLRNGVLELLTQDHTLMNDVLALNPGMTEEKARTLPRHVITQALGMMPGIRVSVSSHAVLAGDVYLLCSDGLTDQLDDEQITEAMREERHPEKLVRLLLGVANAAGASDNVAALAIHCEPAVDVDVTPGPPPLRAQPEPLIPEGADGDDDEPEIVILRSTRPPKPNEEALAANRGTTDNWKSTAAMQAVQRLSPPKVEGRPSASLLDELKVVPADSLNPPAKEALEDLAAKLPEASSPSPEREATMRFGRFCEKCGQYYDGRKDACPTCWT